MAGNIFKEGSLSDINPDRYGAYFDDIIAILDIGIYIEGYMKVYIKELYL